MKKILAAMLITVMLPISSLCVSVEAASPGSFMGWNWSVGELNGTIELDHEVKHSGDTSVKMSCQSPRQTNKYLWLYTPVEIQAGKTYEFGMWS